MRQKLLYRNLLKEAIAQAVENGDTIIYSWPDEEEFKKWEKKLDDPEWFPTINAIIVHEKLRAGLKISWNGFPGPNLFVGTVQRLSKEENFEDFVYSCNSRNHRGPITLVPSHKTFYP